MPFSLIKSDLKFSPLKRTGLLLLLYTAELAASLWLAYELRFDFMVEPKFQLSRLIVLCWLIPLQLILLALFNQFSPLLGYFSTPDLARILKALTYSSIIAGILWLVWGPGFAPPRGIIIIDFGAALLGLSGIRLALRALRESRKQPQRRKRQGIRRVGIIGAGDAGAVLAHELSLKPGFGLNPVAFFDDDTLKWHSRIHDIPVLGPPERVLEVDGKLNIQEVIIAMPSARASRVGEIVRFLREAGMPCQTVPSLDQLALGHVRVTQLRKVEVQDLLGRERVKMETEDIQATLQDRVILVTGAGGSIGSELCRQIAICHPRQLLLLDRSEPQIFQIEQELIRLGHGSRIVPLMADILDRVRMEQLLAYYHPQIIFHAAAHKHVPLMEFQPGEAVKNNSLGTAQLADLALAHGADRFILISTDKAINPSSVMGATKRLAEIYIQALYAEHPNQTKFMAVRFGNVLGSSGSVIPLFQRQIDEGGPVQVTHPEMTRYFMTIPEAAMLVLQSAVKGSGGEIFVLDMGKPVKILELARQMIELSGFKPDEDIKIEFIGVRPGEKLFEELTHGGENCVPTAHPKILRFLSHPWGLAQVRKALQELRTQLHHLDPDELKRRLQEAVPEFNPDFRLSRNKLPDREKQKSGKQKVEIEPVTCNGIRRAED